MPLIWPSIHIKKNLMHYKYGKKEYFEINHILQDLNKIILYAILHSATDFYLSIAGIEREKGECK
jgi:hypothetical protein